MADTPTRILNVEDPSRGMGQKVDQPDRPGNPVVGEHAPRVTPERPGERITTTRQDAMKNRK